MPTDLAAQAVVDVPTMLLIGGKWRPASDGATFPVVDPATGDVLAQVSSASEADALDALAAAHEAFPVWRATPPRVRVRCFATHGG